MKKIFVIILSCFIITALFSSCSNNEPLQSSVNPSSDQSFSSSSGPIQSSQDSSYISSSQTISIPTISMQIQNYDNDNIVEIPKFDADNNEAADRLNYQIADELIDEYNEFTTKATQNEYIEIKSYPFTDNKYIQVVVTEIEYPTYADQGEIYSYNYDISNNKIITLSEAMKNFNITNDTIRQAFSQYYQPQANEVLDSVEAEAFRIIGDNIHIYLDVSFDNPQSDDFDLIYTYDVAQNTFIPYDGTCLVDPAEPDVMSPPLSYAQSVG